MQRLIISLIMLFSFSQFAQADITTGLVGWWKFDEGSGTSTIDSSGQGNNGDLTGHAPTWVAGTKAGALNFDGSSQYVITATSLSSLDITAAITLSAWVYATKNSGIQNVISKSSSAQNTGYIFPRTDDGWTNVVIYLNIGGWKLWSTSYAGKMNSWHLLTATYDGSTVIIYIDGVQQTSGAQSGAIASNTNGLAIGVQPGYSEFFGGMVDDVRIYNRALRASEVYTLYVGGSNIAHATINHLLIKN